MSQTEKSSAQARSTSSLTWGLGWSFGDQPFELELARQLKLFCAGLQLFGKLDIVWGFLEQLCLQFASLDKRSGPQITSLQTQQIKGVVDQRDVLADSVGLQELK